jgi:hypothetical protein
MPLANGGAATSDTCRTSDEFLPYVLVQCAFFFKKNAEVHRTAITSKFLE